MVTKRAILWAVKTSLNPFKRVKSCKLYSLASTWLTWKLTLQRSVEKSKIFRNWVIDLNNQWANQSIKKSFLESILNWRWNHSIPKLFLKAFSSLFEDRTGVRIKPSKYLFFRTGDGIEGLVHAGRMFYHRAAFPDFKPLKFLSRPVPPSAWSLQCRLSWGQARVS